MLLERSYTVPEFLMWTRRTIYVLILVSVIPVVLYEVVGIRWLVLPFSIIFLLGTTVALSTGFKNLQTYNRMQDAQQAWSSITSGSRAWGVVCRDQLRDALAARRLVDRHFAWLAALRHELRQRMPWETADKPHNVEYNKQYSVPEREQQLSSELAKYLSDDEAAIVLESHNPMYQVMTLQSADARRLLDDGTINAATFAELQRATRDFLDQAGKCERIKFQPYPRQHAIIHRMFIRILCVLLPFGMISEFERLNEAAGWTGGHMVWLAIPLSLLISWMYASLDLVSEATENPFEGGSNDVPISQICQEVEVDLKEMLGEKELPEIGKGKRGIAV